MTIGSSLFVFCPLVWGWSPPVNAFPPNNSRRFFDEGREQLERNIELLEEIQNLENQSLVEIDEGVLQGFQGGQRNLYLEKISEDTFVLREHSPSPLLVEQQNKEQVILSLKKTN